MATDKIARAFPKAQEIGFESEMGAFGLNFCHGIGLGLHERPIISRLNSFDDPMELEAGMIHVNGPTIHDEATVPFGGVKDSGSGREGGRWSIDEMTEVKWVTIQMGRHPYPF